MSNADDFVDDSSKISKNKYFVNLQHNCQITSLISTEKFLVGAIGNEIVGWQWSDLVNFENESPKPRISWTIRLPISKYK